MTYGELKDRVLQLIFSYSIAGDEITLDYNNQEDYVKQIPALLNACLSEIYSVRKIETSVLLENLLHEDLDNGTTLYTLPDDCLRMRPGLIIPKGHDLFAPMFTRFNGYKRVGGNKFFAPSNLPKGTMLEYDMFPTVSLSTLSDTAILNYPDYILDIVPFYIAAFVVMYDDAFRYSALYNEFETRLARLPQPETYTEDNEIMDMYGGFYNGWCI